MLLQNDKWQDSILECFLDVLPAKYGYDFKINSGVSTAARRPGSRETEKRKPRIQGFPSDLGIYSDVLKSHYMHLLNQRKLIIREGFWGKRYPQGVHHRQDIDDFL